MIEIKHKLTGEVLKTVAAETLSGADLRGANLRGADLSGANLSGANLIVIHLPLWTAIVQRETTSIGCQSHKNTEWMAFTDEQISEMHSEALSWWQLHKPLIQAAIEAVQKQEKPKND